MKKLLLPICLLLAGVVTSNAQGVAIGVRAGLNLANQSITASGLSSSPDSKTGYLVGGYATIMFSDKLGVQPELFLSSVGSTWPSSLTGGPSETLRLNYVSIPVLLRYNVAANFHLLAGPQIGILASAKGIAGSNTQDLKSDFNSADISGTFGAGMDFGPFNAGVRYNFSFSNTASDKGSFSGATVKNNVIQIVAGFKLFGK